MEGTWQAMSDIQVISYKHSVERATEKAMKTAATMIGGTIQGHAAEAAPVDTGLLHNSITYALGGEAPAVTQYTDDIGEKTGSYEGSAPDDKENEITVYVGTNVDYAPYQELGAPNINLPARPFLRPAFENNEREIAQIIENCFKELR